MAQTVYSYNSGQDTLNATPGATAEIQDPSTGQWYPYVPGDPHDNGRGNIRVTTPDTPTTPGVADPGLTYSQVGTAADGVPIYQGSDGKYYTKNPDGSYAEQDASVLNQPAGGAAPPPPAAPPPATGGGGGALPPGTSAPNAGGGGLINPFPGGDFVPPGYTPPPAFKTPTFDEAANDPGYQFAQQMGQQGVERSAAARGVLNTGGTLQDIAKWNQGLATQQYGDVYNRALGTYNQNYTTQYLDPYKNAYQSALQKYQTNYQSWLDRINQSKDIVNM
jgi:hypothetical protein